MPIVPHAYFPYFFEFNSCAYAWQTLFYIYRSEREGIATVTDTFKICCMGFAGELFQSYDEERQPCDYADKSFAKEVADYLNRKNSDRTYVVLHRSQAVYAVGPRAEPFMG